MAGRGSSKGGSDLRWNGQAYLASIKRHLIRKLDKVGEAVVARVKENISTAGPAPSSPGEYPHRQTGDLQASITHSIDMSTMSVGIKAEAEHAKYVEAARPFLRRTLGEMMDVGAVVEILEGK
jgi:hypothetical protein